MSVQHPRVAIIGFGFGAEFIPIYQRHSNAEIVALCQRNPEPLKETGDKFGIAKRYTDYDALLADPDIDAVHINTPIPNHAENKLADKIILTHLDRVDRGWLQAAAAYPAWR
jgi:predicted dehydrogenase